MLHPVMVSIPGSLHCTIYLPITCSHAFHDCSVSPVESGTENMLSHQSCSLTLALFTTFCLCRSSWLRTKRFDGWSSAWAPRTTCTRRSSLTRSGSGPVSQNDQPTYTPNPRVSKQNDLAQFDGHAVTASLHAQRTSPSAITCICTMRHVALLLEASVPVASRAGMYAAMPPLSAHESVIG